MVVEAPGHLGGIGALIRLLLGPFLEMENWLVPSMGGLELLQLDVSHSGELVVPDIQ